MCTKGSYCTVTACRLLTAGKVVEWDDILIIINLVGAKWPYFQDMKTISHAVIRHLRKRKVIMCRAQIREKLI